MTEHAKDAESVFLAALDKVAAPERIAYVETACAGNAALLSRVRKLLACHYASRGPLDVPPRGLADTIDVPPPIERSGTVIGPYRLLQQIGEGGMGVVWMAEQTHPVQRKVAVKVIKPGMDSRQVTARFEAERQALAMMDHVNIARVFDAGATEAGRPYFVMELVHGVPITKYCDDNHLTPRQRLELFVPVCQAIQHAHQKGIIHRDIKPSNVMITLYDGKPVPKVIDFGVAKATEQKLTERTLFTQYGTLVGTLEYMSPEQAEMSALGVDTRSDIYSLGVLLYELLTGSTPLTHKRMKEAAYAEILRMIKEEEPPKPSTRLSDSGEALASISAQRHTDPAKLTKLVRGELDWIVMKTLEKDRNRRYETAKDFAADVQRYLTDEPVQACPPSAGYRLRKFVRRNKGPVLGVAIMLTLLLAGIVGTSIGLVRERQQAIEAEKQRRIAHANYAKAREAVNEWFTQVSETTLFDAPGLQPLRAKLLESARKYYEDFLKEHSDELELQGEAAATWLRLAFVYHLNDRNDDAIAAQARGVDIVERLMREQPRNQALAMQLTGAARGFRTGPTRLPTDLSKTFATLQKTAQLWETLARENPSVPGLRSYLAKMYDLLASAQETAGQQTEAVANFQKSCGVFEDLIRENPKAAEYRVLLVQVYAQLARLLTQLGRPEEAQEASQRATALLEQVGTEPTPVPYYLLLRAQSLAGSGSRLAKSGQPQEAEKAYRQSVALLEKLVADYPDVLEYRLELISTYPALADLLRAASRLRDAEAADQKLLEAIEKLLTHLPRTSVEKPSLCPRLGSMVTQLANSGRRKEAEVLIQGMFQVAEELVAEFPRVAVYRLYLQDAHGHLWGLLSAANRPTEAEAEFAKCRKIIEQAMADLPGNAEIRMRNGYLNRQRGWNLGGNRPAEAEQAFERAARAFEELARELPEDPGYRYHAALTRRHLAGMLQQQKRPKQAEEHYRKAVAEFSTLPASFLLNADYRSEVNQSFNSLVALLRSSGRLPDAILVIQQSIEFYARLSADMPKEPAFRQELAARRLELAQIQAERKKD